MKKATMPRDEELVDPLDLSEPPAGDDTTAAGHLMLQQQRRMLYYLRLIEHELPRLVGEFGHLHLLRLFMKEVQPTANRLFHQLPPLRSWSGQYLTAAKSTRPLSSEQLLLLSPSFP